jgi:precorrin-2 dehydrogenase/sirohydrochlorin ferrochelatase
MRMLPLSLDLSRLRLVLVGNGDAAVNRLRRLEDAGAMEIAVFADAPSAALAAAAGARLRRRVPALEDLIGAQLVFLADTEGRGALAEAARAAGAIVHVEDEPALSDVQAPAVARRGALTIAVSTGGASPALAAKVRDFIAGLFGPEWDGRLEELSRQRQSWRKAGKAPHAIADLTGEFLSRHGWLSRSPPTRH